MTEQQPEAPARYRVREPVTVDAIEWTGDNEEAVRVFAGGYWDGSVPPCHVVRGVTGHVFTVDNDRFAATYEPAASPPPVAADPDRARWAPVATKGCGCGPDDPCDDHAEADPADDIPRGLPAAPERSRARAGRVEQDTATARTLITGALLAELGRRLYEYENAITWNTSCTGCAAGLDSAYAETVRREKAEAKLAEFESLCLSVRASAPDGVTPHLSVERILGIIGSEERPDHA